MRSFGRSQPQCRRTIIVKAAGPPDRGSASLIPIVAVGAFMIVFLAVLVPLLLVGDSGACGQGQQPSASSDAQTSIPANYLTIYQQAGAKYGIGWNVLAGIGKVETGHGTSKLPGVRRGENFAGAGGPMQFLAATWKSFGVDGNGDGKRDRYDPADAIPGAARYLKHNGAPERTKTALYMYNHSWDYVDLVLSWAKRYATGQVQITEANTPACIPGGAPIPGGLVGRIISFAMAQRGKPYVFGASGPGAWDCSSLIRGAYRSVGISIPRTTFQQWPFGVRVPNGTEQPGDLVFFNSGPGTAPGSPGHVGLVIGGGQMVVARCTACVPAITTQPYKIRPDLQGFTRPLARPEISAKINQQ
jgi:cell wall-associated NlpC family hydrolase